MAGGRRPQKKELCDALAELRLSDTPRSHARIADGRARAGAGFPLISSFIRGHHLSQLKVQILLLDSVTTDEN